MREVFADLLAVDGVKGVVFFSAAGDLLFEEFPINAASRPPVGRWRALLGTVAGFREAELLFEKGRIYIRAAPEGTLIVATGRIAPGALIRLTCDILMPSLARLKPAKGLRRFFSR
ncbi:MAG: hypothetical protein MUD16_02420 [Desulfobacterales bacterium]|jgi:hypothetical protein|nr:hypothetical protein [Desulfobacterales bacterium]